MTGNYQAPVFVIDGLDVTSYATLEDAMSSVEGIDVEEGVYKFFDAAGRRIILHASGTSRGRFVVDVGRVDEATIESTPTGARELRECLVAHLRHGGHIVSDDAALPSIVKAVRETQGERARATGMRRPSLPTVIGLLTALAGPPLFVMLSDRLFGVSPRLTLQIVLQLLYCAMAGAVIWIVVRHERLPFRSIGLRRPDWLTVVSALVLLGVIQLLPVVTAPLLGVLGTEGLPGGIERLASVPLWFRLVLAVSGGVIEELLYRGYAIERLATITGHVWVGGALSALAFGAAHIPVWGVGYSLGADLPFGIVMTLFYIWRRDLVANALAHSAALVMAMLTQVP